MAEKVQQEYPQGAFPPQGGAPVYAQQPTGQPQMTMNAGGNRNALNKPFKPSGQRDWSFGIFDCFSACGTCVFGYFCPCFLYAQNASRIRHLTTQGSPHPTGGDLFNSDCLTYGALLYCGCPCFVSMGIRRDVRARYQIEGSGGSDFLCSWCCIPCALTQEQREIQLEEQSLTGTLPPPKV